LNANLSQSDKINWFGSCDSKNIGLQSTHLALGSNSISLASNSSPVSHPDFLSEKVLEDLLAAL
jgi:hypothetical protein